MQIAASPICGSATDRGRLRISGRRCRCDLLGHCEERSDEAMQTAFAARFWIASRSLSSGRAFARTRWLAMTRRLDFQQILILWMLADPGFDERAIGDHLHPARADLVKGALHQFRTYATAAKFRWHLGMD